MSVHLSRSLEYFLGINTRFSKKKGRGFGNELNSLGAEFQEASET